MSETTPTNRLLSISTFSKLTGISRKNLIYYHMMGIIIPALIKENGYRYYTYDQLNEVSIVMTLKDLEIPLKEIREYLGNISEDSLLPIISRQKEKIAKELNRLNQLNYIIEQRSLLVSLSKNADCTTIFLEEGHRQALFAGSEILYRDETADRDYENFLTDADRQGLVYGYPLGIMGSYENLILENKNYCRFYYKIPENLEGKNTLRPAGMYVTAYDRSFLAGDGSILKKMAAYISQSNLMPLGNIYIDNICDEITQKNTDNYLSKISIPVTS